MRTVFSVAMNILSWIVVVPAIVIFVLSIAAFAGNIFGALFGFEKSSPICTEYEERTTSRGKVLLFPIAGYACKKDAGILNKPAKAVVKYLKEPYFQEEVTKGEEDENGN